MCAVSSFVLFRADWQHGQMGTCITSLCSTDAALVMDSCNFKDESQNAFFDKNTVTIHPMMLCYRSHEDEHPDILWVKHALIGITNDATKDTDGVRAFDIMVFRPSFVHIVYAKLGQADAGDNEAKLMTKFAPEWVRTRDPVIRSPARYRWTTAPAQYSPLKIRQYRQSRSRLISNSYM